VTFTANAKFMGLAILDHGVPPNATTPDAYPQYYTANILTLGEMIVTAGASVADGDDLYWNPATLRYTNTVTHIRIPGGKFDTTAVDGGLVQISLGNQRLA
jgi:subtilase family serine protease